LNFNTHVAGNKGDAWQNVWNIYWVKTTVLEKAQNPYYTDLLHHPHGTTLALHTLSPLNSVIGALLSYVISFTESYNVVFLANFALSGFSMYLLAFYLTKNRFAAFVAGCIFAFSPYHLGHGLGHMNLISLGWMPLFVLYLLKRLKHTRLKTRGMQHSFLYSLPYHQYTTQHFLFFFQH